MSDVTVPPWRVEEWFPKLDKKALDNMKIVHDQLHASNRVLNLVAPKTLPFADAIHFADSVLASQLIRTNVPSLRQIHDLASGNGFPGLVFAILYPEVEVILVDSDPKKIEYLGQLVTRLKMTNVRFLGQAVESLPANSVKYCMARGFASISKSILVTRKTVAVGGVFFHLKGESWSNEVGEIPTQLCSTWTPALVGDYKLPIGPTRFAIVKTDKIA